MFTAICDAIRTKTGGTDPINHQDIPTEIGNIPTGGSGSVKVAIEALNPASYSSANKNYTMTTGGTLRVVVMKNNSTGNPAVTKNGTGVNMTWSLFGDSNKTWAYWSTEVAKDDVINVNTGNVGAGGANAYVMAYVDPS